MIHQHNENDTYFCIVETQTPTSDQVLGPGGVRDRQGRLVSQYKNPTPWTPNEQIGYSCFPSESRCAPYQEYRDELLAEITYDAARAAWKEWGLPFVRLHMQKVRSAARRFFLDEPKAVAQQRQVGVNTPTVTRCLPSSYKGIDDRFMV